MTTELTRRRFLALAGATAGAAAAGAALWPRLVDDHVRSTADLAPTERGRVLVVVELAGGNDGLNTLVPAAGAYRDARPTLALPEPDLVPLDGLSSHSLHPALAPLAAEWSAGRLAAVQGVGIVGQSRSHFAATDRWRAAREEPGATSWLGRWLDATGGSDGSPLRAIALGVDTRVLAAEDAISTVVLAPDRFRLQVRDDAGADAVIEAFLATAAPVSSEPTLAAAQLAVPATVEAVDLLARAQAGTEVDDPSVRHGRTTRLLETAARIVALDVGAQVLVVGVEGFDTHGRQADRHADLLADVAAGIRAFLDEMDRQGRADDVLVLTTSEFGRRVAENASLGTDHGFGNVAFLAGAPVRGGLVGETGLDGLVEGDLPIEIDTRSLYAVALDWLGGPTDDLLGATYDRFDLLRA